MQVKELGHLVLYVSDLERSRRFYRDILGWREAVARLRAEGVPITGMSDHGVTHSVYITDPDGNEIELYIDVQPEVWRKNPKAILGPIRPLRL